MRYLLLLLTILPLPAVTAYAARAADVQPPNIVFIMADDLGWTDLGCFGSKYYRTPNIDRLCRDGMKFTSAYTCGPNCAPTRACLMSGQYSPRHGVYTVGSGARGKSQFRRLIPVENNTTLAPECVTVAEAIRSAGYATAHMGKWHLGDPGTAGPLEQGFDLNIGGTHAGHPSTYFSPYRNRQLKDGPRGEYLTDRLTDEAVKFIEANRGRPFFLYLPHYAVHTPLQAKREMVARYKERPPAGGHRNPVYAAMIDSVDQSVGRIVDKLRELDLADNTVVIFYSDNGGVGGYAKAGVPGAGEITDNAPLRGGKGMLYEGGVRVPLVVCWPGVVQPGATCDVPVITVDFYPTLLALAGARGDRGQVRDGVSLVPLLLGEKTALERDAVYWHFPGYLQARGDGGSWRTTPAGAIRAGDWKLIEFFEDGRRELYNLREDIGEKHNLAANMPEKEQELYRKLLAWRKSVRAPMPPGPNPDFGKAGASKGGRRTVGR